MALTSSVVRRAIELLREARGDSLVAMVAMTAMDEYTTRWGMGDTKVTG